MPQIAVLVDGRNTLMRLPELEMFVQVEEEFGDTEWPGRTTGTRKEVSSRWILDNSTFRGSVPRRTAFGLSGPVDVEFEGSCRITEVRDVFFAFVAPDDLSLPGVWIRLDSSDVEVSAESKHQLLIRSASWTLTSSDVEQVFSAIGAYKDGMAKVLAGKLSDLPASVATRANTTVTNGSGRWEQLDETLWAGRGDFEGQYSLVDPESPRANQLEVMSSESFDWLPDRLREVEQISISGASLAREVTPPSRNEGTSPFTHTYRQRPLTELDGSAASRIAAHVFPVEASLGVLQLEDGESVLAEANDYRSATILAPEPDGSWYVAGGINDIDSRMYVTDRRFVLMPMLENGFAWQLRYPWVVAVSLIDIFTEGVKKGFLRPAQPEKRITQIGLQFQVPQVGTRMVLFGFLPVEEKMATYQRLLELLCSGSSTREATFATTSAGRTTTTTVSTNAAAVHSSGFTFPLSILD